MIEPKRCADCGELVFFNHHLWSSGPDGGKTSHGFRGCKSAAETREVLPLMYDHAIQACVEVSQMLGRFVSETDDDEFCDVVKLQGKLMAAQEIASQGIRAERLVREALAAAVNETDRPAS